MLASLLVGVPVFVQKILEKKDLQNSKHNKEFNDDNYPDLSSPVRHVPEAIIIKMEYSFK